MEKDAPRLWLLMISQGPNNNSRVVKERGMSRANEVKSVRIWLGGMNGILKN